MIKSGQLKKGISGLTPSYSGKDFANYFWWIKLFLQRQRFSCFPSIPVELNYILVFQILNCYFGEQTPLVEKSSKSDVFAFGIVVFETLFQKRLFETNDWKVILEKIKSGDAIAIDENSLHERQSENDELFRLLHYLIIISCLQFDPKKRPCFNELIRNFD